MKICDVIVLFHQTIMMSSNLSIPLEQIYVPEFWKLSHVTCVYKLYLKSCVKLFCCQKKVK